MSQDTPTPRLRALIFRVIELSDRGYSLAQIESHIERCWPILTAAPVASARPELHKLAEGLRQKGEAEHAARSLQERGESHGLPGDVSPVARVGGGDDEDASADPLSGLPVVGDLDTTPFTFRADAFNIGEPRYPKTLTPVASAPKEDEKNDQSRGAGE